MSVDLHVHSSASDGRLSPAQIVKLASDMGLSGLALTDHDTIDGLTEARLAAQNHKLQIIDGVELSTSFEKVEVHVLGYFIDCESVSLNCELSTRQALRSDRALQIIEKLNKQGYPIQRRELESVVGGSVIGRPHIAQIMIEKGYVNSVAEAFNLYLGEDGPAYVPKPRMSTHEAMDLIESHGGVAILAHPGLITQQYIDKVLGMDWRGIEVYHPDHDPKTIAMLREFAIRREIIMTGGSDFHGDGREHRHLGRYAVSEQTIAELEARRQR